MTAVPSIDMSGWLHEQFAQALMSADADAACAAGYGERSDERVASRNGYRHREWDTQAGSIDLAIPKLRRAATSPDGC
jgi:putative transposase